VNPRLYIETSVVSYLTSRPSRDLVAAARQQLTHAWWNDHRPKFELVVSELVLQEAAVGDPEAAQRRIKALDGLRVLPATLEAESLAEKLLASGGLPDKAEADAAHISLATIYRAEYLLTWNCKHIANPFIQRALRRVLADAGYEKPVICTPEEFVEE